MPDPMLTNAAVLTMRVAGVAAGDAPLSLLQLDEALAQPLPETIHQTKVSMTGAVVRVLERARMDAVDQLTEVTRDHLYSALDDELSAAGVDAETARRHRTAARALRGCEPRLRMEVA